MKKTIPGRPAKLAESQKKKQFNGSAYVSEQTILQKFPSIEAAKKAANQVVADLFK